MIFIIIWMIAITMLPSLGQDKPTAVRVVCQWSSGSSSVHNKLDALGCSAWPMCSMIDTSWRCISGYMERLLCNGWDKLSIQPECVHSACQSCTHARFMPKILRSFFAKFSTLGEPITLEFSLVTCTVWFWKMLLISTTVCSYELPKVIWTIYILQTTSSDLM